MTMYIREVKKYWLSHRRLLNAKEDMIGLIKDDNVTVYTQESEIASKFRNTLSESEHFQGQCFVGKHFNPIGKQTISNLK